MLDDPCLMIICDQIIAVVIPHRKADGQFTISVPIMVSNQFFGWLAGLGTGVRVESPARVSEEYRVFLQRILGQYEKTTE